MGSRSAPASGEALPMEQEFKQGYRMHRILSNLNRLDVDRLDAADRERVETARDLPEEVSLLTRPGDGAGAGAQADLTGGAGHASGGTSRVCFRPRQGCGGDPVKSRYGDTASCDDVDRRDRIGSAGSPRGSVRATASGRSIGRLPKRELTTIWGYDDFEVYEARENGLRTTRAVS